MVNGRCDVAQGIEMLLEDMVKADAEWSKLAQVPGLVDGWTDVKDKLGVATEEFKAGDFSLGPVRLCILCQCHCQEVMQAAGMIC